VAPITPAPAENAVEVELEDLPGSGLALGAPTLDLTYVGTAPDGPEPTRVFAQIVDEARGIVVGTLVTPIEVVLDGEEHTTTVDLEVIVHNLSEPTDLTLQLVATTVAYAVPRLGGEVTFSDVTVTVPVVTSLTGL
jgi:ABC-2 type transport system ATP-binding protein